MSVLVTGGGGFIGSHLVEALLEQGKEVIVFDNVALEELQNISHLKNKITFIKGDITDKDAVADAVSEDVEIIYHLSAIVGVTNYVNEPLKTIDVNVIGTRNIIEAALKRKTKIVYTSTSEIFGKNPNVPWKEDDDRVLGNTSIDRWTYSTSKAMGEHMLFAINKSHGLPMTIVRYFNVYGPRQPPIFIIPASVHKVLNNTRPLIYDEGKPTRCFTYVDDVIKGTLLAAEKNGAFNLGSMKESNLNEVAKVILEKTSSDLEIEYVDTKKLYGKVYEDIPRRVPDATKAKEILGWEAATSLEEGIEKTIEWCKNNEWWITQKV
jgi:dTDP-alpha-D-glucuronic acid decarboxylase